MSEQHQGAHAAAEPDGAQLDGADQPRPQPPSPSPGPVAAEPHRPRPPALHGGPGVEPGSDDELDAVAAGPSPTHPHEPTDPYAGARARSRRADDTDAAHEPTDIRTPAHEPRSRTSDDRARGPRAGPPGPRAAAGRLRARGGTGEPAPRAVGSRRRRRHRLREHRGRRAVGRLLAGRRARRGSRALRPPLRRRAHRGRAAGQPAVAGGADPKHTLSSARTLRESLTEAHVVGDLVGLSARCSTALVTQAEQAVGTQRAERDAARNAAVARKEDAGRRGRDAVGRGDAVEAGGRPVQGDPRRVAHHPRHRPQDRRGAVEALLQGA